LTPWGPQAPLPEKHKAALGKNPGRLFDNGNYEICAVQENDRTAPPGSTVLKTSHLARKNQLARSSPFPTLGLKTGNNSHFAEKHHSSARRIGGELVSRTKKIPTLPKIMF
jgi:hypothetical protein